MLVPVIIATNQSFTTHRDQCNAFAPLEFICADTQSDRERGEIVRVGRAELLESTAVDRVLP